MCIAVRIVVKLPRIIMKMESVLIADLSTKNIATNMFPWTEKTSVSVEKQFHTNGKIIKKDIVYVRCVDIK